MDAEKQALKALMKMINEKYANKIGSHLDEDESDLEEIKEETEEASGVAEQMLERDEAEKEEMDMEKLKEFMSTKRRSGGEKSMKVFGQTTRMMGKGK